MSGFKCVAVKARESPKRKTEGPSAGSRPKAGIIRRVPANPLWLVLSTRVQARLAIGPVDDPYEREADEVAERVMRMPEPRLQRRCAACEEEEEKLRRKESGRASVTATTVPPVVHQVLHLPGQPLDASTRAFFEPRFGRDFGAVRVHTGAAAAESARAVKARAFTLGRDVAFAAGEYEPGSLAGRRLLAHELVHVLQQSGQDIADASGKPLVSAGARRIARLERPEFTENREIYERLREAQRVACLPARPLARLLVILFELSTSRADTTACTVYRSRTAIRTAAAATGERGIPAELLAAVLTMETMNRGQDWRQMEIILAQIWPWNLSLGMGQVAVSTLAMLQGDIPWMEAERGTVSARQAVRGSVAEAYGNLPRARRRALVEQLSMPGRDIEIAARLLARLKNRPHRYPRLTASHLRDDYDALAIIGTEYTLGPTRTPRAEALPDDYGRSVASLATAQVIRNIVQG